MERFAIERLPGSQYDESLADLAPFGVFNTNDGHLAHCRMLRDGILDFSRIDVLAAGNEQILVAVNDIEAAFCIQPCRVACAEPAVGEGFLCALRVIPIA